MIITVDPGERVGIDGVTDEAIIRFKGSAAEVAIRTADLLVSPRLTGMAITAKGKVWQVTNWRAEGPVCVYTLKEVPNVTPAA